MKSCVIDSTALLIFLMKDRGYDKVVNVLEKAADRDRPVLMAAVNWAEVREVIDDSGKSNWDSIRAKLSGLPIEIVSVDKALAEAAGELKAGKNTSLAGCVAAALAKSRKAELLTSDLSLKVFEAEVKIVWL